MYKPQHNKIVAIIVSIFGCFYTIKFLNNKKLSEARALLPDDRGKNAVLGACLGCHDLSPITQQGRSKQNWRNTIIWMQKMQGMPPLPQEQEKDIIFYLSKHFPKKSQEKP